LVNIKIKLSHDLVVGAEARYCSFSKDSVILFKPVTRDRESKV